MGKRPHQGRGWDLRDLGEREKLPQQRQPPASILARGGTKATTYLNKDDHLPL
jgi:hypothetical protein